MRALVASSSAASLACSAFCLFRVLLAETGATGRRDPWAGVSSSEGGDARALRVEVVAGVAGVAVALVCFNLPMLVGLEDALESLLVFGC
jgi:hypothetical protein